MYTYVFVPISLTIASPVAAASNSMPGMYMGTTVGKNKPKISSNPDIGASVRRLPGAPSNMFAVLPGMYMSGQVPSGTDRARPLARVLGTFDGGTAAVMLTAGYLRPRDRAAIKP